MKVVTSEQMREIDRRTIEEFYIDGRVLMERAGISVVLALEEEFEDIKNLRFLVFCGAGNNGGDGFVVARTLLDYTDDVKVILVGNAEKMSQETLSNYLAAKKIGVEIIEIKSEDDLRIVEKELKDVDVVIDSMLGIGLSGALRGNIPQLVELINSHGKYVVAVDVPTGIDSDNGKIYNTAIKADLTITFGLPKLGLFIHPARGYVGRLKIASIGIPFSLRNSETIKRELITKNTVKKLLPFRPSWGHKGTFGKVLIVSGSKKYTGAPVLVSLGALRSGCGLVYTAVPEPYNTVVTGRVPEAVCLPVKTKAGFFDESSVSQILQIADKVDSVVIGPGMSTESETLEFFRILLEKLREKLVVLDADALNIISKDKSILKDLPNAVLTPHLGEFSRLIGKNISEINERIVDEAEGFASENAVVLVLKGSTTIITDGKRTFLNVTGNTGLSKGGSGDVLSGMIGSFMAQGLSPIEAAICGVYIHGLSAELYSTNKSERTMIAEEIAENLSEVFNFIEKE
ncbi:MAG: ADP-dependent NAD(P)H-hydrate dehydratase / NAD(P)H-hydrate epimerase [Thermotogaceae bacterium]|nr:ADP-dependent NAD(P)H-hydrate dehydratase / NAD(P)H-hydrate epimerase [Thermotogaceae bacterium]MDN5338003.1 ADP-dependent NAD(P)H-hydrate dehydratase / NAD(P)H-hydrate epimerase [Thermotogaceae bacterium]